MWSYSRLGKSWLSLNKHSWFWLTVWLMRKHRRANFNLFPGATPRERFFSSGAMPYQSMKFANFFLLFKILWYSPGFTYKSITSTGNTSTGITPIYLVSVLPFVIRIILIANRLLTEHTSYHHIYVLTIFSSPAGTMTILPHPHPPTPPQYTV